MAQSISDSNDRVVSPSAAHQTQRKIVPDTVHPPPTEKTVTEDNWVRILLGVLAIALGWASHAVTSSLLAPTGFYLTLAGLIVSCLVLIGSLPGTAARYIGIVGLIINVASVIYFSYVLTDRQMEVDSQLIQAGWL